MSSIINYKLLINSPLTEIINQFVECNPDHYSVDTEKYPCAQKDYLCLTAGAVGSAGCWTAVTFPSIPSSGSTAQTLLIPHS